MAIRLTRRESWLPTEPVGESRCNRSVVWVNSPFGVAVTRLKPLDLGGTGVSPVSEFPGPARRRSHHLVNVSTAQVAVEARGIHRGKMGSNRYGSRYDR